MEPLFLAQEAVWDNIASLSQKSRSSIHGIVPNILVFVRLVFFTHPRYITTFKVLLLSKTFHYLCILILRLEGISENIFWLASGCKSEPSSLTISSILLPAHDILWIETPEVVTCLHEKIHNSLSLNTYSLFVSSMHLRIILLVVVGGLQS